jgi:GDPmannose 4,6-dehydratase
MTRHLVTGAGGQDGRLLVDLLRRQGGEVVALSLADLDVTDTAAFRRLVARHRPDVVHNLAALSSVGRSWAEPETTDAVNHRAVVGMLEVLAELPGTRFVHASSSEIFGPVAAGTADEDTPLAPASPYGEAKAAAHLAVAAARSAGVAATNLILFGHTGPGHDPGFVIPTICRQAAEVARGGRDHLELRDPTVARDWGSAADFVRAFALAADAPAGDYVVATGELHRLGDIARWALDAAGVDAEVRRAPGDRPHDFGGVRGDNRRAARVLGWQPRTSLRAEVEAMVVAALEELR